MDNLKDNQLIFVKENNEEVVCDILFTYHSENFNKDYVFFIPLENVNKDYVFFIPLENVNDDGTNDVACASYIEKDNAIGELNAVESDEEWEELSEVFDSFLLDAEEDSEEE